MSRGTVEEELREDLTEAGIVGCFVSARGAALGDTPVAAQAQKRRPLVRALASPRFPIGVLLVLIALCAGYTGYRSPFFWSNENLGNLLLLSLPLICVAVGQQFALLSGGFDISVGSTMSFTVVLASMVLVEARPGSLIFGLLVVLAAGIGIGLFNALLTGPLKVNSIVATLATLGILQGLSVVLRPQPDGFIAPELATWSGLGVAFVPGTFIAVLLVAGILDWWLSRSGSGLAFRAVGFDSESSRRVGVSAQRLKSLALVACAVGATIGGLFLATQVGIGSNSAGISFALPAFAACFLGGAVLTGGRGTFVGAALGALFVALINNIVPFLNVPDPVRQILNGMVMLVAVATYAAAQRSEK
jgi:ribose transport system ATP-binding protein